MKPKSLYLFVSLFTFTASSLGATILYTAKSFFDNNLFKLESEIFSKFKSLEEKFFKKFRSEIVDVIYKNLPDPAVNFFVKEKNSTTKKSSTEDNSSSESSTKTDLEVNKKFLNFMNGNLEGFLVSFSFYQDEIKSENIHKNFLKLKDQFFVSVLYLFHLILVDLDELLKEMQSFVDKNKSNSDWKFMLNESYFTFLSDFFDSGKEIFFLIKKLSETTDLVKTENKLSEHSNFMLLDSSSDIILNIPDLISNIENLIKNINFSEKKENFKNYYENFVFSNPEKSKEKKEEAKK